MNMCFLSGYHIQIIFLKSIIWSLRPRPCFTHKDEEHCEIHYRHFLWMCYNTHGESGDLTDASVRSIFVFIHVNKKV